MSYPQGNFYPQGSLGYPQGIFGPREGFGQQANYSPQGNFGAPGPFGQQTPFGQQQQAPFGQGYQQQQGYPQQQLGYPQQPFGYPPQQFGYPQQQPAILQLLAHQLAAQQLAMQHPTGATGLNGIAGAGPLSGGSWPQQQPHHQLLQQLAQFHYVVAQQLTQLAAQLQSPAGPYTGQFIPGSLGANFVPGITMH